MNEAEELLAVHLQELEVPFFRDFAYAEPRRFRADFMVISKGYRFLIEVQGGVYSRQAHGSIKGVLADNERLNQATLHGYRMLRFTPNEVKDGSARAFISEVLAR